MPVLYKNTEQIKTYMDTDSVFLDYARFEGDAKTREAQKKAFMSGQEYTPTYDYGQLDFLIDDQALIDKKTNIYEAVLELEVAKEAPGANASEIELYRAFHELRLKKIMLVEAARDLKKAQNSTEMETARQTFMELNEEVYGEFDTPTYKGMLATEIANIADFQPTNDSARRIKDELTSVFSGTDVEGYEEEELLDQELLSEFNAIVMKRYEDVFSAIPETDDSTYYDVDECVKITNHALEIAGLAKEDWKCEHNPKKTAPATNVALKKIYLPSNTRRSASELQRLIAHELEDHARRGQNGINAGSKLLRNGTADYADVEEGLGVMLECAVAGTLDNPSFERARDRYITAGLALGGGEMDNALDARQVYEVMWRLIALRIATDGGIDDEVLAKAKDKAYTYVENAFRGTEFWMKGVIYTKLKVYYEGFRKNAQFFKEHAGDLNEALDIAMIGKYNHTDPKERILVNNSLKFEASL